MGWLFEIALGVCLIILAGGLVNWVNIYLEKRSRDQVGDGGRADQIQARLSEIERRLTDVQDVMIALSEKFDRWEEKRSEKD